MGFRAGALEDLVNTAATWSGCSVVVTGHTGFKGGWLSIWLEALGARVHGYALNPPTQPSLCEVARLHRCLASDTRADLADLRALKTAFAKAQPAVVFHLAAQPLVRESYRDAIGTFATNVQGTAHVLEAVRCTNTVKAVVIVTTDKVYENRESVHHYRETDALGGHDPYSASKAAAEIATASYRDSFFGSDAPKHPARVASARAGNVIGGADWATDRLVPDCLRAFDQRDPVKLRFPDAVRPWQHVLEPLSGYLVLGERLLSDDGNKYASAWNFGPDQSSDATVATVADMLAGLWADGASVVHARNPENPHEAGQLRLDSSRARAELGWRPRWSLAQALEATVAWHRAWKQEKEMLDFTRGQIREYQASGG